jgi:hypothetical protein
LKANITEEIQAVTADVDFPKYGAPGSILRHSVGEFNTVRENCM